MPRPNLKRIIRTQQSGPTKLHLRRKLGLGLEENSAVLLPIDPSKLLSTSVVDLTSCDSVAYEMRDGTSGVKYTKNGTEAWTPVKKRRPRRKRKESQTPVFTGHNSTDSDISVSTSNLSNSELDVSCGRMVQYSVRNGIPGVSIHRRNVDWKPITPSPVASRTRSRNKN